MIEHGDHRRHIETVVGVELENGVRAVLVDGIEAEQLRGALAVDREVGADHDRSTRRTHIDAAVGAMQAIEVARERRHPGKPEVGERHRVGVLTEAVARQDRIGVVASQIDEHAPQAVHRAHQGKQLLALQGIDPDRAQVA